MTLTGAELGLPVLPYEAAGHDDREQQEEDQAQFSPFHFHLLTVCLSQTCYKWLSRENSKQLGALLYIRKPS